MIYGKVAQRFSEKGMAVTPLKGKVPVINGWETTRAESVTLEKKYNKYNIGLLCGEPSGIIVADIDTADKLLEAKLYALMPETPVMKKGKKGINFFYRWNNEETIKIHNPINKRLVEFELISTGRQTVIPRSIHPESKKPYIWCDKNGEASSKHLLNVPASELPCISNETLELIRECVIEHFAKQKQEILEKKAASGVAGLIENYDKIGHKDLPDYNPKTPADIPEGYHDRSRSGSHDSIVAFMMALINKGKNKEQVIQEAMKYDADYNIGYASTYFTCRTNKGKGETPYEKAEYYYNSSIATVKAKKEAAGEVMPVESVVIEHQAAKEMDAVHNVLCGFGIHYDSDFTAIPAAKKEKINLVKEGKKDFFMYDGRKWNHTQQQFTDTVYRRFNQLMGFNKSHNQITAAFSKFVSYIPNVPHRRSFFKSNPYMANFHNGTLHMIGVNERKLVFKPHNREDFCTDIIDLDYGTGAVNQQFNDMLVRIFDGDQDSIYALQEMFALALMPAASRIFFLYGVSGSGKSTIGKILAMLIGEENLCQVDPSSFDGFNMESMVNKKVNMDMDISVARPISDGQFKKIEDGNTIRIRRKGKEDIYANIPFLHIFGANTLPKNFDSASGAYDRRITIIRFDKSFTSNNQNYDRNYAEKVYNSCPEGILNFAIAGLERLIKNEFRFTVPKAGKEAMNEWNLESDPIGLFLVDLKQGEVEGLEQDPIMGEGLFMKRDELWAIFNKWKENVGRRGSKITRNKFYKIIEDKGIKAKRKTDGRYFEGIGYVNLTAPVENQTSAEYSGY
jgi:P4 family phage/plasmid primase-like protien